MMEAIAKGFDIGLGILNTGYNIFQDQREAAFAREKYNASREDAAWQKNFAQSQFDYAKQRDKTLMEREDNAIQRKLADATAAGFSPLAALGQQSATSVVGGSTPGTPSIVSPQGNAASASDVFSSWMHESNVLFNAIAERSSKKELKTMETENNMAMVVKQGEDAMSRLVEQGFIDKDIALTHLSGVLEQVQASLDINNKTLSFQGAVKTFENMPKDNNGYRNALVVKDSEIADVRAYWVSEYCAKLDALAARSFKGSASNSVSASAGFSPVVGGSAAVSGGASSSDSVSYDNSSSVSKELDAWFAANPYPISESEYGMMRDSHMKIHATDALEGYKSYSEKQTTFRGAKPYGAWLRERGR